jgi:hypothetical protein
MKKFVLKFMLAGLLISLFLLLFSAIQLYLIPKPWPNYWLIIHFIYLFAVMVFWPTRILSMADSITAATIIAVISNIFLYGIVGFFVWIVKKRNRKSDSSPRSE